ncbi:midcut-by-XrtH protein [uncultured Pseudoteredinibacter sp.]|uniref:midcut-by-XrtH protein n=1 Tax=uncultured Pseudoteredinibacter sp. TaxID=1641701 RepID=UPI002631B97F|nr:midcut-by-XrtH protein [uncultured Pseudoteredinibacter sp.]
MKLRALGSIAALFLFSQASHAQIVIGPPSPQEVPIFGAPLLLLLGGLLGYVAYRFKAKGHAQLHVGLLAAGSLILFGAGSGISIIESSQASGNFIAINGRTQNSHTISGGTSNDYRNDSGITLEIKSIQLPSGCPNNGRMPEPPMFQQCSVNTLIPAGNTCYIDCI